MANPKLYSYFRSSASFRVRMALNWKEIKFEYIPIHLTKDGGQQNTASYRAINPMGHVPLLEHDGFLLSESMAIIQYLDEVFPGKHLFPTEPKDKARVLQLCEVVNSGIQPLQNLKVQKRLEEAFQLNKTQSDDFVRYWIKEGLGNLEKMLEHTSGSFCFGGEFSAADCFVAPQIVTAARFGVGLESYPNLTRIFAHTAQLPVFKQAHPEQQPDFQR
jgi:maleylpyruvate isomerase